MRRCLCYALIIAAMFAAAWLGRQLVATDRYAPCVKPPDPDLGYGPLEYEECR